MAVTLLPNREIPYAIVTVAGMVCRPYIAQATSYVSICQYAGLLLIVGVVHLTVPYHTADGELVIR